jgi:hypothetical protein
VFGAEHGEEDAQPAGEVHEAAENGVEDKEQEVLVVGPAHAVDHPRAVVVELERTLRARTVSRRRRSCSHRPLREGPLTRPTHLAAKRAVMGARRLGRLALATARMRHRAALRATARIAHAIELVGRVVLHVPARARCARG